MRMASAMAALIVGVLGTSLFADPQDQNSKASVEQHLQTQYPANEISFNGEIARPQKAGHVEYGCSDLITQKLRRPREFQRDSTDFNHTEPAPPADGVVSILGPPLRTASLPHKDIYIFKDLKVTFKGKVSDVE